MVCSGIIYFFKQKTACEMRISDWSSDVCSSDVALTDTAIRRAKPEDKPQKLRDGGGLYLLMRPDGARWWRMDYRRPVTGKRNTISLGTYPVVGLAEAREKHQAAKKDRKSTRLNSSH